MAVVDKDVWLDNSGQVNQRKVEGILWQQEQTWAK